MYKIFIVISLFCAVFKNGVAAGTCPSPTCTYTAVSGNNYSVNSGETVCVSVNYSSGTITLNGGTMLVKSGGTVDWGRISFGNTTKTITAATNASPISCTATAHAYVTGQSVYISGGTGNTAVNGTFTVTVVDANTFTLDGSSGNGTYGASTATVGYVNTLSNCDNITGTYDLDNRKILNNYADNAIALSNGSGGGTFNNYGSPPSFGITNWNLAMTIDNKATGLMTLTNGTVPTASTIYNNSSVANGLTWSAGPYFSGGTSTAYTSVYNRLGSTTVYSGNVVLDNYLSFNNSGTVTMTANLTMQNTNTNGITNYGTINLSGTNSTLSLANSAPINNYGTINVVDLSSVSGAITMNGGSVFKVSRNLTNNSSNVFSFGTGSCAYVNLSGGAFLNNNNRLSNTAADKIFYCGPTPGSDGATVTITTATNASPIVVTTSGAHGFVNNQKVVVSGVGTNTAANATWTITYISATSFSLNSSTGNGAGTGGTASPSYLGTFSYLGSSSCTPSACAVLPIKLLTFDAKVIFKTVKLSWVILTEVNNDFYTIERSADGVYFYPIAKINGGGNSSAPLDYQFVDEYPLAGVSYYRLKQTDYDGDSEEFAPKTVNVRSTQSRFSLYPNPSHDGTLYIHADGVLYSKLIQVCIVDVLGQMLFTQTYNAKELNEISIVGALDYLAKGVYFVQICSNENVCSEKWVVE